MSATGRWHDGKLVLCESYNPVQTDGKLKAQILTSRLAMRDSPVSIKSRGKNTLNFQLWLGGTFILRIQALGTAVRSVQVCIEGSNSRARLPRFMRCKEGMALRF